MGHRYIGSKTRISDKILKEISKVAPKNGRVVDLMCGTGAVAIELRKKDYRVVACDVMLQACMLTKVKLLLKQAPPFKKVRPYFSSVGQQSLVQQSGYQQTLHTLNSLNGVKNYFWREFSPDGKPESGTEPRKYFTSENAQKIDAARAFIRNLREEGAITDVEHALLIHDLIMAVNDVANIAGTYGHYLSKFVQRATQTIKFTPARFEKTGRTTGHKVMQGFAEELAEDITADVCYIDPPYIKRQYAANYHILETLAKEDTPPAIGKSGLRPWRDEYSDFCSKVKIRGAFARVFNDMKCKHFLISYSSEGLLTKDEMLSFFREFGRVSLRELKQKRFKSRDEEADEQVTEYLFRLVTG